jgi:hypothetical protein
LGSDAVIRVIAIVVLISSLAGAQGADDEGWTRAGDPLQEGSAAPAPMAPLQKAQPKLHFLVGGHTYIGGLKDGRLHGKGTLNFADGRTYVGDFHEGELRGQGIYRYPDGRRYVGEFLANRRHGHGVLRFADGESYQGQWSEGRMHGQGTLTWPDGEKYLGEFQDGRMHGHGKYVYANGEVRDGVWENGQLLPGATGKPGAMPEAQPEGSPAE